MYKVEYIKTRDIKYSGLEEKDHISAFLNSKQSPPPFKPVVKIEKLVLRDASQFVVLFSLEELGDRVFWCKVAEYEVYKFALENATTFIRNWYIAGSVSAIELPENRGIAQVVNRVSSLDGYEVHLAFD